MKVESIKGNIFHLEKSPILQILLDSGLITEVKEYAPPVVKQPTKWQIGRILETGQWYINAECPNQPCLSWHLVHNASGPKAHEHKFQHCGFKDGGESCPPEIAAEYLDRLRKKNDD